MWDAPVSEVLAQLLPAAGLRSPATFTVLPHTLTGTSTGSWTVLPAISPGEPAADPSAPAPSDANAAHAGSVTASAPEAATASRPFRVTLLMRFPAFQTWSRAFARTG
ncbi:hypothetical protein STENM36S_09253 [Streptomyces tendae]